MTIYAAGPLAAGPLCGLLTVVFYYRRSEFTLRSKFAIRSILGSKFLSVALLVRELPLMSQLLLISAYLYFMPQLLSSQYAGSNDSAVAPTSESVKCRFSKCRLSALNLKFDFISDGGCTREKQIQKALGSLPPCGNRCRFSESAICSSRVHPPSEIKSNFKFKTLRWRPLRWRLTLSDYRLKPSLLKRYSCPLARCNPVS